MRTPRVCPLKLSPFTDDLDSCLYSLQTRRFQKVKKDKNHHKLDYISNSDLLPHPHSTTHFSESWIVGSGHPVRGLGLSSEGPGLRSRLSTFALQPAVLDVYYTSLFMLTNLIYLRFWDYWKPWNARTTFAAGRGSPPVGIKHALGKKMCCKGSGCPILLALLAPGWLTTLSFLSGQLLLWLCSVIGSALYLSQGRRLVWYSA